MTNRQQNLSLICNRFCRNIGTRFVVIRCMELKNKTILVVDDEPDIREILVFNLEQEGYRVCKQVADRKHCAWPRMNMWIWCYWIL